MPVGFARKAFSALLMYGVFGATQGAFELLRVAPRLVPASQRRDNPWIAAYDHHWWQLAVSVALLAAFSRGRLGAWAQCHELAAVIDAVRAVHYSLHRDRHLVNVVPPLVTANARAQLQQRHHYRGCALRLLVVTLTF